MNFFQAEIKKQLDQYAAMHSTCSKKHNAALLIIGSMQFMGVNHSNDLKKCKNHCYRVENNIPSGTNYEQCYALHAEIDVIFKAQKTCSVLNNGQLWVTSLPCANCAKAIIAAGISVVYYFENRDDDFTKELFKKNKVSIHYISPEIKKQKE